MQAIIDLLNHQSFIALFLVIGLGYAAGKINIAGFSLGIGAVLFVGLAMGAIAPKSAPPGLIGLIGLILFLYGIGIQYGKHFFNGLASSYGLKANLLAAFAVVMGCLVALGIAKMLNFQNTFSAGVFAGSLTSTASLHASMEASGSKDPAVGYAIAYPFGVFGPMLCFYMALRLFKPIIKAPTPKQMVTGEIDVADRKLTGKTVGELTKLIPEGVQLLSVRRKGVNVLAEPTMKLKADDRLMVAGMQEDISALDLETSEEVRGDHHDLDYVRVFVSKLNFIGMKVSEIPEPEDFPARIIQVRRGDNDMVVKPDLVIEYGDQLGVLVAPDKRSEISKYFGDSIKAESEFSFVSLGIGMAVGGLIGLIPIPIPGIGTVSLGVAGGVLIMSLILGYYGRWGPFDWHMPLAANVILRNFGLTLFLASVGMSSGAPFAANVLGEGLSLFVTGVVVLLTVVLIILFVGYYVLKMEFDDLLGIASGATGNPAILAYGNQLAPTGKPDIGYAMIFPGVGTILKILAVQIMVTIQSGSS